MMQAIILFGGFILAFIGTLVLASKNGSKAAQLEALKAELKRQAEEQRRANEIMDTVRNMPESAVRDRLHNLQGK